MLLRGRACLACATLTLVAMAGCSVFNTKGVPLDSSAGLFDKARLSYQVDTDRINTSAATGREGRLVSYHQGPAAHLPVNARASVDIRYPHPEKRAGMARVEVRIASHGGSKPADAAAWKRWWLVTRDAVPGLKGDATTEIWTLDIPKSELATIVSRLNSSGYFAGYEKSEGTEIATELDGSKVAKSWHQLPELDTLIVRVRTEGRLVSSSKAPDKPQAKESFASVAFYRSLLAKEKKNDSTPEGYAVASDEHDDSRVVPAQHVEIVRLPEVNGRVR
jgi:hypothetical protein